MDLREGSVEAKALFTLSASKESSLLWLYFHTHYDEALQEVAKAKKKPELVELDHFLRLELPNLVQARSPKPHVTHEELAKTMKWKLTRGKMRPLQKVVESNSPTAVVQSSTKALDQLLQGHWHKAFDHLCELRGIGTATASALLSFLDAAGCPFMADEVIDVVYPGKRDYTMKIYEDMRPKLINKAQELNSIEGNEEVAWTAESVGRALWTCAKLNMHTQLTVDSLRSSVGEGGAGSTADGNGTKKRGHAIADDEPELSQTRAAVSKRRRK